MSHSVLFWECRDQDNCITTHLQSSNQINFEYGTLQCCFSLGAHIFYAALFQYAALLEYSVYK